MAAKLTPEELRKRMEEFERARKAELLAERAHLRTVLREIAVEIVDAQYHGYGDSGNVEEIAIRPLRDLGNVEERLAAFLWSFAYDLHPGFENNEGGQGAITWRLETDRIDIRHEENYTEIDVTEHEGL